MRPLLTLLIVALTIASCRQPETITPQSLTGVWVEKSARQDTLTFNPEFQRQNVLGMLLVKWSKQVYPSGYTPPKNGDLWTYILGDGKILVKAPFSSLGVAAPYIFEGRGNELRVENFYELGVNQPATAIRTLVRLK
ncbi:hypothetical protein [Spirosoma arcticum]